jgi:hypothetical protein
MTLAYSARSPTLRTSTLPPARPRIEMTWSVTMAPWSRAASAEIAALVRIAPPPSSSIAGPE